MVSTVAVVEDEPRIRRLYATWLEERYDVVTAADGNTALATVDADVEVVLLDRRIPDLSGDEVLHRLRDRGYEGWVVLVTAVDPTVDVREMAFDDYLVKPINRESLHEAVEVVRARSEYDRDLRAYFRVLAKLGLLETALSGPELADSEEYASLEAERRRIKDRLDEIIDELAARDALADLFLEPPEQVADG